MRTWVQHTSERRNTALGREHTSSDELSTQIHGEPIATLWLLPEEIPKSEIAHIGRVRGNCGPMNNTLAGQSLRRRVNNDHLRGQVASAPRRSGPAGDLPQTFAEEFGPFTPTP